MKREITDMSTSTVTDGMDIELADEERTPCEIWTRVMGYHRPVSSFNTGKKGEYAERVCFSEPRDLD
jgi:anaerobic ribonucleoside-triphosphate reductase